MCKWERDDRTLLSRIRDDEVSDTTGDDQGWDDDKKIALSNKKQQLNN